MRPVVLIGGPDVDAATWFEQAIREIERASQEADVGEISDDYTILNPPTISVRTLDCSNATLADVVAVVATLILDLQARGTHRGS